ncbi:NAD(P)H-quinone oxidoreductase [Paraglaciecola arctica]|uniref:NAD(P)H-quinone oxidoreductase n=1 Tax=Paraglaciecola arctica TaxID=1128911 RepID=UPI001C06DF91|nr:NAD(P)H-quinone oxidoreductase [Paraglaciecola arctica]MBU3002734.1 NAD(P)H-quinone oxidoreductase [Paraglaciecola arctica]
MQYIKHQNGCAPDALEIQQGKIPELAPNQVLLKVACFGLNRADTLQRQGKYPAPVGESEILGLEASGTVVQIHPQQTTEGHFKLDDKVFGLVAGGGYAEYVAVNTEHLMLIPTALNMTKAAGIAECFLTAYQVLFIENDLQPNQHILIHAGASGVGLAAIQLAKRIGCSVAVTASGQAKLDLCTKLGADLAINYQTQNFAVEIPKYWQGCDLVVDFVGGDYLNRNLKVLNRDGKVVYLAMLAGRYADQLDMALMLGKRATIKASTLRNRSDHYKAHLIQQFTKDCLVDFDSGQLFPNIDSEYPASDIGKAHQRIENNQTMGKLIGCW